MGKNKKSIIKLNIFYFDDRITFSQKQYSIQYQKNKVINYHVLLDYLIHYLKFNNIYQEVKMSYFEYSGVVCDINPDFIITHQIIHQQYNNGTLCIMLQPYINILTEKIAKLENRIVQLQQQLKLIKDKKYFYDQKQTDSLFRSQFPTFHKTISQNLIQKKNYSITSSAKITDIIILFSQPLIWTKQANRSIVETINVDPIEFRQQIYLLKQQLKKTSRGQISIKCEIGTTGNLINILNSKLKILHLICHTEITIPKDNQQGVGILFFQQISNIGVIDPIPATQILSYLKFNKQFQPKLIFINSCHSERLVEVFQKSGIKVMVLIQTHEKIHDKGAKKFTSNFYTHLFNGKSIRDSFNEALNCQQIKNNGICCCFHTKQHNKGCLWVKEIQKDNEYRCHKQFHIPLCQCKDRFSNYHEKDCLWAIQVLFRINKDFGIIKNGIRTKPNVDEIKTNNLLICCCSTSNSIISHDNKRKFMLKGDQKLIDQILFPSQIYNNKLSEVYDQTSPLLLNEFKKHSKVIGRNTQIYKLIESIKNERNGIILVSGCVGEGRTSLVVKTVNYMHQRKQFKSEYFHLDLISCSSKQDLEIIFSKNSKMLKGYTFTEIIKYLKQKDSLIIFDNADLYCNTCQQQFADNIKCLRNQLPKTKFIIIISDETSKKLDKSILLFDMRIQLQPLSEEYAAQLLIKNIKNYLQFINYEHIKKLFKDSNFRNPKVILNISQFIKNKFAGKKVNFIQIQQQLNKILLAYPSSKTDPFLLQNLKFLKQKAQVYKLFQFLNQFQDGLNELDFTIISNRTKKEQQHNIVNDDFSFVTQNWKQTLKYLIAENFLIAKQSPGDNLFKQGDYYYCIVQKNIDGFLKIRIKKYINQEFKRLKKDQQDLQFEKQIKFYAIAYLSIYSTLLVQIYKEKYFYHQDIIEYNNTTKCGIFLYVKQVQKRSFFDEGDYYPNQNSQFLTRSINKAKTTDHYLKEIFKNNELEKIHPNQSIFHHRENFSQIYKTDYSEYYKQLPSQKKKLFKYYYQIILLNIPSLIKLTKQKVNVNFLKYSIDESIRRMDSLDIEKISKTNTIHILKLQMMKLVEQIEQKKHSETNFKLENFNEYFKTIENRFLDKKIELNAEINKTIKLDILMIKIHLLFQNLKQNQINLKIIIVYIQDFLDIFDTIFKFPETKILFGKFNLLIGQIWYYCKTNNIQKNTTIFSNFQNYFKHHTFCERVIEVFKNHNLKFLEVKSKILYIKLNLIKKNNQQLQVHQLFQLRKDYLLDCKNLLSTIKYNQLSSQLSALQDQINNKIWETTNNFLIFMKASPFTNKNNQTIYLNTIRKNHNFKKLVQFYLVSQQDKKKRKQKAVSVRFQVLTLNRLNQIIPQGCSILVLTTNIIVKQNNIAYIQFEQEQSPIQSQIQISSFCQQISSLENLNILIVCGQNSKKLMNALESKAKQNCPIIISIEYIKPKSFSAEFFLNYYNLYSIQSLQKIASNYFLSNFCKQVVYTNGKIHNQTISDIFIQIKQQTKLFMMKFSKFTHNSDKFDKIIQINLQNNSNKQLQLNFTFGQYHNISSQQSSLHNIKQSTSNFAGRANHFLQILKKFNDYRLQNKPCYINLYGCKGFGKSSFTLQLAQILIERGYFKSGIYILKGWEIYNEYKGQISEYLQHHKNDIFSITYLNEKKVDNSKMLLIIDDFHALKDRGHFLQYFFNSIYQQKVNFILISNEKLEKNMIPLFNNKKLEEIELKKLKDQESALLAFTFIPLYDYEVFTQNYYRKFKELKQSLGGKWMPSVVITEFEKLFKQISNRNLTEFENYKNYIKNKSIIIQSSKIKLESNLKGNTISPLRNKRSINGETHLSDFSFRVLSSANKQKRNNIDKQINRQLKKHANQESLDDSEDIV